MDPQLFRLQLGCFTGSLLQNILQDDLEICSTKAAMLDWSIVDMEMMAYVWFLLFHLVNDFVGWYIWRIRNRKSVQGNL